MIAPDLMMIDLNRVSRLVDFKQLMITWFSILEHSCIIINILSWLHSHMTIITWLYMHAISLCQKFSLAILLFQLRFNTLKWSKFHVKFKSILSENLDHLDYFNLFVNKYNDVKWLPRHAPERLDLNQIWLKLFGQIWPLY